MKTLAIENILVHDQQIKILYSYNGSQITREYIFGAPVELEKFKEDEQFMKLVNYCALISSVYLFDLEYFDEIKTFFSISEADTVFFEKTFLNGLAEFRYKNDIPILQHVKISSKYSPANEPMHHSKRVPLQDKAFVLNGGGKDGVVGMHLAQSAGLKVSWFSLSDNPSRQRIRDISGVEGSFIVEKKVDEYVKRQRVYKGHKPLSACVALLSILVAYVSDTKYIVASNEYSANFGNLIIDGFTINHQYSKSIEFESDLRELLKRNGYEQQYFSIIRPLYELQVLSIFSKFESFHKAFISCNEQNMKDRWCMSCSKCAFMIAAFFVLAPDAAKSIWGLGELVINQPKLQEEVVELINPQVKPFECIGTIEENRFVVTELIRSGILKIDDAELENRLEKYLSKQHDTRKLDIVSFPGSVQSLPPALMEPVVAEISKLLEATQLRSRTIS